jgi:hypothetical protein
MKTTRFILVAIVFGATFIISAQGQSAATKFFTADHPLIQYTGRIDFSNPLLPRFWQPAVYITTAFEGSYCAVVLNDEQLWGINQNYLEIVVDGKAVRVQTKGKRDTIVVANGLSKGKHSLVICKNTEANIGWLEMVGIICNKLIDPGPKPTRKIEFIGNSITCGASSDPSMVPCGKGKWQDQHNAYMSYGAVTARSLDAQYHLSSVSGIGLIHSCCKMDITMPQVYDKVSMRNDTIAWNFSNYQPDVVTVCLGQNDGIQDSTQFCNAYISFLKTLKFYYPKAMIVCLSSPMADHALREYQKRMILSVVKELEDPRVGYYFFNKQYIGGCDYHPDINEHKLIADQLSEFLKKIMGW